MSRVVELPLANRTVLDRAAELRADFPVLARSVDGRPITYLDSAATTLKPQRLIDAVVRYYSMVSANIHRGKHMLSEEASTEYERVRYAAAQYLRVPSAEVVFVRNTTHGLNLVARGLGLGPNDLVVVGGDAHHSNLLPWRVSGASCAEVRVDGGGQIDLGHFEALLKNRPSVVALTHCSNATGIYAPLAEMASMAKDVGALVVVDAAQSAPHGHLDLRSSPIDFVAFSAHKMLGPTGVGVLWGRGAALARLAPVELGGGTVDWVGHENHSLREAPHRFEAGTPDIAAVYGFGAALRYLEDLGSRFLRDHDRSLASTLVSEARRRDYVELLGAADAPRCATISFSMRGVSKLDHVARALSDSYGVMCRTGHLCAQPLVAGLTDGHVLRMSGYVYNTRDDVVRAFAALDEIVDLSKRGVLR